MKDITQQKVFKIWRIKDNKAKYELVDTIDIEVKINEKVYTALSKKIRLSLISLMLVKDIGEKVQKRVLNDKMFKNYDAYVFAHMGIIWKGKITVSIDVFKVKKCKSNLSAER